MPATTPPHGRNTHSSSGRHDGAVAATLHSPRGGSEREHEQAPLLTRPDAVRYQDHFTTNSNQFDSEASDFVESGTNHYYTSNSEHASHGIRHGERVFESAESGYVRSVGPQAPKTIVGNARAGAKETVFEWLCVAPFNRLAGCLCCWAMVSLLLFFLFLFAGRWEPVAQTTSKAPKLIVDPPVSSRCLVWGDPHIQSMDGAQLSLYESGDFWFVKTGLVWVQGSFEPTPFTDGLAATQKVAIGGAFLANHKIIVGSLETGEVTFDGQEILPNLDSVYEMPHGLGTLKYDTFGDLVDVAQNKMPKRVVHMSLPLDVRITIFRWKNYVDLRIDMPRQPDQDGACGNGNGNILDDTVSAVMLRSSARVASEDLLFGQRAPVRVSLVMAEMLSACPDAKLQIADKLCRAEFSGANTIQEINSCKYDVCYGSKAHALRIAKTYDG